MYLRRRIFKITKGRIRNIFFAIIILLILFYVHIFIKFKPPNMAIKSTGDGYSIHTAGCSIPSLHPYGPAVIPFIFKNPPLTCGNIPPLVTSDLDTLYVNTSLLSSIYNVTNLNNFHCCYQEMSKKILAPGMYRELSNYTYIISQLCIQFITRIKVDKEFVRVICEYNGKEIYRDFHAFVLIRKSQAKKPSVLVMGVDSTSRVNLHRQMPKTAALLQKLRAFEFLGYNKVGDNTYPNVIPALAGKSIDELHADCLTSKWYKKTPTKFDLCKFIWNNFSQAGFLTAFAEDSSWLGTFCNGYRYGFQNNPTDYYWNLYNYVYENELGFRPFNKTEVFICVGGRFIYHTILEYMKKFIYTLINESYFGWFWQCSLTHSEMNMASLCDEDYSQIFQELNETNVLNNTIIIFLSDHGPRMEKILLTHQGYLEERLPFLYVLLPSWFSQLYPTAVQNIDLNTRRLVTAFDVHETLNDLVNIEDLTTDKLQRRVNELGNNRGISLFLPISETRTCTSSGIPMHWCSCFQSVPVETTDIIVTNIAYFLVNYINLLLDNHGKCAKLSLHSIITARLLISEEFLDSIIILRSKLKLYNYIVTIKTGPGGGIFQSTVRCYNCDESDNYHVQGQITRLNMYGRNGNCIEDLNLRMYCNCIT